MNVVWVAVVGIAVILLGFAGLGYDTLRRRRAQTIFEFPDQTTTLIEVAGGPPAPAAGTSATASTLGSGAGTVRHPPRGLSGRASRAMNFITRRAFALAAAISGHRAKAIVLVVVALAAPGIAALAFAGGRPVSPAGFRVAVCPFAAEPALGAHSQQLSQYISESARGVVAVAVESCPVALRSSAEAERERRRRGAEILVWGLVGDDGSAAVSLQIDPELEPASAPWQRWSERSLWGFALPQTSELRLPATLGVGPVAGLVVSVAALTQADSVDARQMSRDASARLEAAGSFSWMARAVASASLQSEGAYADAAATLDGATIAGGAPYEVVFLKALALYHSGQGGRAQASLDDLVASRDADDRVVGAAHALRARIALDGRDISGALSELDQGLRLLPSEPAVRLLRAEAFYRDSRPDASRSEVESIVMAHPEAAPAYRLAGQAWISSGRPDAALGALQRADDLYAGWQAALRAEEARNQAAGFSERARNSTSLILILNREMARVAMYRGVALADMARKEPADSLFASLWRRLRGQPTTFDRAVAALEDARRLDPHSADILIQLGTTLGGAGRADEASAAFTQAVELEPAAPQPALALARFLAGRSDFAGATATLTAFLSRDPANLAVYDELAATYRRGGDEAGARSALTRALAVPARGAEDHLWRGKFLLKLDRPIEAVDELKAARADPRLWEAALLLGNTLSTLGDSKEALTQFRAVLEVEPDQPEALMNAATISAQLGDSASAERLLRRLTAIAPSDADALLALSDVLVARGDLKGGVDAARRASVARPERADVHFKLGLAEEALGDWGPASDQYRLTVERDPSNFEARVRYAACLVRLDRYTDALEVTAAALQIRPADPQTLRWRADALLNLRDTRGAIASARKALDLQPDLAEAAVIASRASSLQGNSADALQFARRATALQPTGPEGHIAAGDALLATGDVTTADSEYQAALSKSPASAEALTGRGRAAAATGDVDRALQYFASAAQAQPTYAEAHLHAGNLYSDVGRWDEALKEYSAVVSLRPNWPEGLYRQGKALLVRKDLAKARTAFERAVAGDPNLTEAWFGRGLAARDLGRRTEAIESLTKAVKLAPSYAEAWLYLALTLEEAGDRSSAENAFSEAARTATDSSVRAQALQGASRVK